MAPIVKDEISVITTSMNYGRYLDDCIKSVLGQKTSFPFRMNHIIMDGGSTDDTAEIVGKYGGKVHFYMNKGEGQTPALNHAMKIIEEEFPNTNLVGWLNADDYYSLNWLQYSLSVLRHEPLNVAMTCGNYSQTGVPQHLKAKVSRMQQARSKRPTSYVSVKSMTRANVICQPTVLLRMSAFRFIKNKYGFYFNPEYHYAQDVELWSRFLANGYKIAKVPDIVATLRRHPKRMSNAHREDQLHDGNKVRRWLAKMTKQGGSGLKIAFIWGIKSSYLHKDFWENKFDSMQFAISNLTIDHYVRVFAPEKKARPRQVINGQDFTFYKYGDKDDLIKHLKAFNPNMLFLNVFSETLWKSVINSFPNAWKSVMDFGSISLKVPLPHKLDAIIVQQEYQRHRVASKNKVPKERVKVNTFGIRRDIFKPIPMEKTYTGIMIADFRRKIKRQHLLIKAWKNIPGKLLLVGRYERSIPKTYHRGLKKLAKDLGIRNRVKFVNGYPNAELPNLINKAKIGYLTSYREGGSRALLEMMACGLPSLVTSDCDGSVKMIRPNVDGLVADPNPKDIANKTLKLLKNYNKMGEAASKRVREQYPYRKMLLFYRKLIAEYKKGGSIKQGVSTKPKGVVFNKWKRRVRDNVKNKNRKWYHGLPYKWWWGMNPNKFLNALPQHLDKKKEPKWFA